MCGEPSASLGRYYAVFDGHGGAGAAHFCAATLRRSIEAALDADVSYHASEAGASPSPPLRAPAWDAPPPAPGSARAAALERAVTAGFLAADAAYADVARQSGADDGAAAVIACVFGCRAGALRCLLAWAGDCAALLLRRDGRCERLTPPHSALAPAPAEAARFSAAGGEFRRGRALLRRADGRHISLAMTRAIGDYEDANIRAAMPASHDAVLPAGSLPEPAPSQTHLQPVPSAAVTAAPELTWLDLRPELHLGLLLCSDGVTDALELEHVYAAAASAAPHAAHAAGAVVAAAAAAAPPGTPRADDATAVAVLLTEGCDDAAARLRMDLNRLAHAAQPAPDDARGSKRDRTAGPE